MLGIYNIKILISFIIIVRKINVNQLRYYLFLFSFLLDRLNEPSLVLILKWGGELTPAGRIQAEELGRIFRCMYPGGQGRHLSGSYHGTHLLILFSSLLFFIFYSNIEIYYIVVTIFFYSILSIYFSLFTL